MNCYKVSTNRIIRFLIPLNIQKTGDNSTAFNLDETLNYSGVPTKYRVTIFFLFF